MKIKKLSLFFAAVMAVLCLVPASFSVALAASDTVATDGDKAVFVSGYEYKADYVFKKVLKANGLEFDEKDADGKTIDYYFDYKKNGADFGEVKSVSADTKIKFTQVPDDDDSTVAMTMRVCTKKASADSEADEWNYKNSSLEFYICQPENNANTIAYNIDSKVIGAYQEAVNAVKLELGGKFYWLSTDLSDKIKSDLIVSKLYDVSDLTGNTKTRKCYYAKPGSSSFSSTTSDNFSIDATGTYSFYMVFEDLADTTAFVDLSETDENGDSLYERKIVGGIEGFYDSEDNLIVPVFTFTIDSDKAPEITIKTCQKGFFGLEYEIEAFNTTVYGSSETKKYTLYFCEEDISEGGKVENWNENGHTLLESGSRVKDITDDEAYGFDSSSLTFTPNNTKGYYFVVYTVSDGYGTRTRTSNAIVVQSGFKEVKRAFDVGAFFQNNYLSIIFLSIAVLSAIGIVLLIFIKPKEKSTDEEVTPVAKK